MFDITKPDLAELRKDIAACDDLEGHHILWVDHQGKAHFSCVADAAPGEWAADNKSKIKFRLETLCRGNGYVGPRAAADLAYVQRTYDAIVRLWNRGATGYVDVF